MNLAKIFQYIKNNLNNRLKTPYVSNSYTEIAKEELLAGIRIALQNAEKVLTTDQIIDVFNAMNPAKRANMKFPIRKGSVAFLTDNSNISEQGILELLEWAEINRSGYGPRFELVNGYSSPRHFKTVQEMRDSFKCQSNSDMAKVLFNQLKNEKYRLRYIPPFDSINPFIDSVRLSENELSELTEMQDILAKYEDFDLVWPKFEQLIAEFNQIQSPSLVDIARFIKSMILLHPFPDGNGRTFTLGILNQLLLKNKLGICLDLDPRITLLSCEEIAVRIKTNLIKLEQFELEKSFDPNNAEQKLDLLKDNFNSQDFERRLLGARETKNQKEWQVLKKSLVNYVKESESLSDFLARVEQLKKPLQLHFNVTTNPQGEVIYGSAMYRFFHYFDPYKFPNSWETLRKFGQDTYGIDINEQYEPKKALQLV
ncbi:Fic family protein [Fluoribacter gormanii]|uniref:Fic family protein n=1 Tax=Fluoribacter gormanii TaxID=464 RepID=UPI0010418A94|nr:Fic family protein [Fluoribacter gormanii]MCW8444475.1 Fic family protein [Fluoribacter gormanii]MCW8469668.1 Fic family protein [Fluoribacter gormanii]